MNKIFGFIILLAIIWVLIAFIGFMFSVHWSLGVIAILFIIDKVI